MKRSSDIPLWEDTKRIRNHDLKRIMDILDNAYFALATEAEIMDTGRHLKQDPEEAKAHILEAINTLETLEDVVVNKLDTVATDIHFAIEEIKALSIDVNITKGR